MVTGLWSFCRIAGCVCGLCVYLTGTQWTWVCKSRARGDCHLSLAGPFDVRMLSVGQAPHVVACILCWYGRLAFRFGSRLKLKKQVPTQHTGIVHMPTTYGHCLLYWYTVRWLHVHFCNKECVCNYLLVYYA